jgi:hypothetical protein
MQASVRTSGDTWRAQLCNLLHDCAASAPAEQADRIREAHALLCLVTELTGQPPDAMVEWQVVEAMLSLDAHESAVLSLMGGESSFMLSRGTSGICLASAVLPDGSEEMVAEGSTLALALLTAYLSSLVEDSDQPGTRERITQGAAARLN